MKFPPGLRLDAPDVKVQVTETASGGRFSSQVLIERAWRYDLGDGRRLRLELDDDALPDTLALEKALAAAAGWPLA